MNAQGISRQTLALLADDFWIGLEAYAKEREAMLLKEGADAATWEDNLKAKGARYEALKLPRLRELVEEYARQRALETKKALQT